MRWEHGNHYTFYATVIILGYLWLPHNNAFITRMEETIEYGTVQAASELQMSATMVSLLALIAMIS